MNSMKQGKAGSITQLTYMYYLLLGFTQVNTFNLA